MHFFDSDHLLALSKLAKPGTLQISVKNMPLNAKTQLIHIDDSFTDKIIFQMNVVL